MEKKFGLEVLYEKYKGQIYSYLYRQTKNSQIAEELCQEVFLKAFQGIAAFQGKSSMKTWLYRIAHNEYISWYRKENKKRQVMIEKNNEMVSENFDSPEQLVERKEKQKQVQKVLEMLKEDYRTVLILSDYEGLTYKEIAITLNWSLSKVKVTLYRARICFRKFFQEAVKQNEM